MEALLRSLNTTLQTACETLEGPLRQDCLSLIQTYDELPEKEASLLASETVDLLDHVLRLLQPPVSILAESYLYAKCLWAAVASGIPEALSSGPQTLTQLATLSNLQPLRLQQLMRVLCNNGIFQYDASVDSFSNNLTSNLLKKSHWTQWYRWVDLYGNEFYDMARGIPKAVEAGEDRSAAQIEFNINTEIFDYFAEKGLAEKLHRTLGAGAMAQAPGMMRDYSWASIGDATILDIGGGGGDFIVSLLRANPYMKGSILELQSVVNLIRPFFEEPNAKFSDISDRLEAIHVGDFTKEVPSYEVYTMKWCLHNWTDEKATTILQNVRRAIVESPRSRLVIIESVLTDGRSGRVARYGDIIMMLAANGRERTLADWRNLAKSSGWKVESVSPLRNAWPSAIDLRPV
ncbi:MAG: hypothetical protein MMC33_000339 [Icmadophila ericetorum]|nr:hypothetical protein [Icmadophila ericetorum]